MYEYHRLFGLGRWEDLGRLFEGATYQSVYPWSPEGHGVQRGAAEVTRNFTTMVRLYDGLPRVQYSTTNIQLEVDEDAGTAHGWSQFIALGGAPDTWAGYIGIDPGTNGRGIQIVSAGRYEDTFQRVNGAWRFASRICYADLTGDRSVHLQVDPVEFGLRLNAGSDSAAQPENREKA